MPTDYLLQEDGASKLILEDGTGDLILESSAAVTFLAAWASRSVLIGGGQYYVALLLMRALVEFLRQSWHV